MKRRVRTIAAVVAVIAVSVAAWYALTALARSKREARYRASVKAYASQFPPSMTRAQVRKLDDGQRIAKAIRFVDGKRLEYRESVDNPPYLPAGARQMDAPFEE